MNANRIIILILFMAVLGLGGYTYYVKSKSSRVGYVKLEQLLEKYQGVAESKTLMENKMSTWQSNIDTLENRYNISLSSYESKKGQLKLAEQATRENTLKEQYDQIHTYAKNLEQAALEENKKLNQGLMHKIDAYLKKYAKENGYDLIMVASANNYMVAGSESADLTEEITKGLNQEYVLKP